MQSYEGELNHLAKLEEFLRVKGSRRICEADEKEEIKRQEEVQRCEQEIARHDALLEDIFVSLLIEIINSKYIKKYCERQQEPVSKYIPTTRA
jgi:hypothetical protein